MGHISFARATWHEMCHRALYFIWIVSVLSVSIATRSVCLATSKEQVGIASKSDRVTYYTITHAVSSVYTIRLYVFITTYAIKRRFD